MKLEDILAQLKESDSDDWSVISTQNKLSFNNDINIYLKYEVDRVYLGDELLPFFIRSIAKMLQPSLKSFDTLNVSKQTALLYYNQLCIKEFSVYGFSLNSVDYFIPEPRRAKPLQFKNKWLIRILNADKQLRKLLDTFDLSEQP